MQRLTVAGSPLSTREGETTGNVTVPEARSATPEAVVPWGSLGIGHPGATCVVPHPTSCLSRVQQPF